MTKPEPTSAAKKARRQHTVSLLVLAGVLAVFLALTTFLELPSVALIILYLVLLAAAVGAMWTTMNVMISRRGDDA